jgi:SAM-dependent methyltransferase
VTGDSFGALVQAWHAGERGLHEVIERDDGYIDTSAGPQAYFEPLRRWPAVDRRALRFARGRVLDVGVGAGRVALELQRRGRDVVGIDVSPGALEVARNRGVPDVRLLAFVQIGPELGELDTVLMYGNNFGLFGHRTQARRLLRRLHRLTTSRGRIVAGSNDPTQTEDPAHLAYQERNRRRGRLPGHLRLRVRYRNLASPWFDYLLVSPEEMRELAAGTGWHVARLVEDEGSYYVAVLEKDEPPR